MDEIRGRIKDIMVHKLGLAETEITPDANFIKDLGIDSLDYAELVMEFEQAFNIKIPDNEAEDLQTIRQAVQYIAKKLTEEENA